ncbi:MarR family winged helix-turn-helix transcriptional regulator [Bifidobacterium crudilactis]|jgi:DNA-binding MarR family transcriptional regulator|uniref:MarR family winged helix-turn-helix transcriptional regulator n=1 Tax=Bifidobacterium crudilactis TaxID=327277 RepID=UPI0023572B6E|nr:MarR family transcriptional regulator [Bifidobacterium crudilactis]MCI1218299.1 MarR family transcriptional regulator [Bifidobacterium crudilactis]
MFMNVKEVIDHSYDAWFGMNHFYEEWAKSHGMTGNTLMIFYVISNIGPDVTPRKIIDKLHLPKQTVTSTLNVMEGKGYIIRETSPNSGREKVIQLTDSGQRLSDGILAQLYEVESGAYSQLSSEERDEFIRINQKLLDLLHLD